jgi:RNA polymerase sigma-70 factor (ECF subfamily)
MISSSMENSVTDAALVAQVQAGDDRAFDELMRRHKRLVLNFIYRLVGDATEAEDLALDVFVRAYRALSTGSYRCGSAAFSTWLFQVARNAALDFLRHQRRHPTEPLSGEDYPASGKTAPQDMAAQETGVQIAAAVAALPEDQRTAIILSVYEDRSHVEIAAIMKTSAKSVEARLYRARQFLRLRLAALLE